MSTILLKDILHNSALCNILIEGNRFVDFAADSSTQADLVLDCKDKAILPAFYNAHTHASMSLLRGYADDLELFDWLSNYIWPMEAKMTAEDIAIGARLACLEMIKTGTVFFADMYWHFQDVINVAMEMGMRCCSGPIFLDAFAPDNTARQFEDCEKFLTTLSSKNELLTPAIMPHSVYGVKRDTLARIAGIAGANNLLVHIHLSETEKEVTDCLELTGMRPVEYLDSLGLLTENTIAAHVVNVNLEESQLLVERGVKIAHVPVSNMKLCSGTFPSLLFESNKELVCLGTDGCSSNNSLSMLEDMKFAALLAKHTHRSPRMFTAHDVFDFATKNGAAVYGIDAGVIERGRLADCIIVDLRNPLMVPGYNVISDLVYSADSSCIDTVICNGKLLMLNGRVEGEHEIVQAAKDAGKRLLIR